MDREYTEYLSQLGYRCYEHPSTYCAEFLRKENNRMNTPTLDVSLVALTDGEPRTTSLLIAEGTDYDHASVIKLVRNYASDLADFGLLDFKSESTGGRPTEYASLNEGQSTFLLTLMRNNEVVVAFKKRLVKAFLYLKSQAQSILNPANMTRMQLLELAMQTEQERIALEHQVGELAPKASALDKIALADGLLCLTDAAKTIGVQPQKVFIPKLREEKWIYKRTGSNHYVAYQDKLQQMVLEHKITTVSLSDGGEKITEQVFVTPKGLAKLATMFQGGAA